jgi:predicted DNA-binding WGR domain protein
MAVRFGRIGTDGQEKATSFADAGAAARAAEALIREKIAKGYKEVKAGASAPAANAKAKPAATAKPKSVTKAKAKAQSGDRPKAIVFAVDEIPQIAKMADAYAIPPEVRRSPVYFYPSQYADQVKLPPDRVCTPEEAKIGHAFLSRLAVDLWTRDWKENVYPLGHIRAWHDVPVDVLVDAFDKCGFDVVAAADVARLAGYAADTALAAKLAAQKPTADATADLMFADVFGLTRVTVNGKATSDPKLAGRSLSIDRDGRVGLLRQQLDIRVVLGLADGRELGALDRGLTLHPAGGAVVEPTSVSFQVRALKRTGTPDAGQLACNVYPSLGPARAPLGLRGGGSIELSCDEPLVFDAAGNYLAWFGDELTAQWQRSARSVLFAGRYPTPATEASVAWSVELLGPVGGQLSLSIADGVPVACLRDVAAGKVDVAVFGALGAAADGADGAPRVRTIDSVTVPARVGQTLLYQPDDGTLAREPLDGGSATRHELPAKHAGRGRVVSRGDRWLFVPAHGESLLDLEHGGREIGRGLPAKQQASRTSALAALAKVRAVIEDAGMDAQLTKSEEGSVSIDVSRGPAFLGRAVTDALGQFVLEGGGSNHGASIGGGTPGTARPVMRDELVDTLRFFDGHGLRLEWALHALDLYSYPIHSGKAPGLAADAEPILLGALFDALVPENGPFDAKLARWSQGAPAADAIKAWLLAAPENITWHRGPHVLALIGWITAHHFGREALRIWLAIPEPRLLRCNVTASLSWLAKTDPKANAELGRWFAAIKKPDPSWNQLRTTLGVPPSAEEEQEAEEEKARQPVAPPAGFDAPTTWDAIVAAWSGGREIHGQAAYAKSADHAAVARKLGVAALPPSYLEYVRRFYPLGELRKKYERDKLPYFLSLLTGERMVEERDLFRESLASSAEINTGRRRMAADLAGLIAFGSDTDRTSICWDPAHTNADGEMLICFIDIDERATTDARTDVGYDLKEVLKYYQPGTFDERD